jgi:hypothetical protein
MKKMITIFPRQTFVSANDGSTRTYLHDQRLCEALGATDELQLVLIGDRVSSSDTLVRITVYQGADPENRPSDVGDPMEEFIYEIKGQLRPEPMVVSGPYLSKLDITLEIEEDSASPTTQQQAQLGLYATLWSQ